MPKAPDSSDHGDQAVSTVESKQQDGRVQLRRDPLGVDSLLWKYGSDMRIQLLRGYTGILQNMHPAIGQSLLDHSKFFEEPFARLQRSTPQIIESIYVDDEDPLPHRIRDYHLNIKGTLRDGSHYHSLNPETFWWAHATFVYRVIRTQDLFGTPFTAEERDQLCREGMTWWDKYGVSDRPAIDNYEGLIGYIDEMTETILERNDTVDFALRTARVEKQKRPDGVPPALWNIIWKPIMRSMIWLTVGTLEDSQRRILQVDWSKKDQKRLDRISTFIRKVYPKLPLKLQFMSPGREFMAYHGMFGAEEQEAAHRGWDERESTASRSTIGKEAGKNQHEDAKGDSKEKMSVEARRAAGCPF